MTGSSPLEAPNDDGASGSQVAPPNPSQNELVSIVIPTFNSSRYLVATLESAYRQTHRPLELIVVDDGSVDGTTAVAGEWVRAIRGGGVATTLIRQEHRGPARARNLGLAHARGRWIQFLDSDDTLGADKIALQVRALRAKAGALAYCDWAYMEMLSDDWSLGQRRQSVPLDRHVDPLRLYLEGWFIPLHAFLWPREMLSALGGFDESLRTDEDGELAIRALVKGACLMYVEAASVQYRLHGNGQLNRDQSRPKLRSRLRVVRKVARMLEAGDAIDNYRKSLAMRCDEIERMACLSYPEFARLCAHESRKLAPGHRRTVRGGAAYKMSRAVLGLRASEWIAARKRRIAGLWMGR